MPSRPSRARPGSFALAVAAVALLGGCSRAADPAPSTTTTATPAAPPTEKLVIVTASAAPLLGEPEDDEGPLHVARPGELLRLGKPVRLLHWKALMDGAIAERDGQLVDVRLGAGESGMFGFRSDLGDEVEAPTAGWICDRLGEDGLLPEATRRPECANALRRIRLADGAFAAYDPCQVGPCPIAIVRGGVVRAVVVEGLATGRLVHIGETSMLLTTTTWARAQGLWTGGDMIPVRLSGDRPTVLPTIALYATDARDPERIRGRLADARVTDRTGGALVRLVGERRETDAHGTATAKAPIDEAYTLTVDGLVAP